MKKWLKILASIVGVSLLLCCGGIYAIIPWSPFQDRAPSLAQLIPADAELAARIDAASLGASLDLLGLAARLDPDLRDDLDLAVPGERETSIGLGLLGEDAAFALRDDEWLLLVRVAGPVHATKIEAIRRIAPAVEDEPGSGVQMEFFALPGGDVLTVARLDDVFLASPSRDLVADAYACARDDAPSIATVDAGALGGDEPASNRVHGWASAETFSETLDLVASLFGTNELLVGDALAIEDVGPGRVVLEHDAATGSTHLLVAWSYTGTAHPLLAPRDDGDDLASLQARAAGMAPDDGLVLSAAAALPLADAIGRLDTPLWLDRAVERFPDTLRPAIGVASFFPSDDRGIVTVAVFPTAGGASVERMTTALARQGGVRAERVGAVRVFSAVGQDDPAIAMVDGAAIVSSSRAELVRLLTRAGPRRTYEARPPTGTALLVTVDLAQVARALDSGPVGRSPRDDDLAEHAARVRLMRELARENLRGEEHDRELERRLQRWHSERAARPSDPTREDPVQRLLNALGVLRGSLTIDDRDARLDLRLEK